MKNLYVLITISIVTFYSTLNAQWIHSSGAYGKVHSLAFSDTTLFSGNVGGNIFRSTDNGASWTAVFSGIYVDALATSDTNIFAGTGGGVYRSTNNGTTWTVSGLTNLSPQALAISDTNLFAGTYQSGVYRSTNNGSSWTAINNGLLGNALKITALFVSDTNLFAGTWGSSAFRSTNNGTTWTSANNGLTSNNVHAFTVSTTMGGNTNLFAGTYFGSGVYLSTDNGGNWTAVSTGLTNSKVRALAHFDMNIFAGTDSGGVFLSTNNGLSWNAVNNGLTDFVVNALLVYGTNLFAGTDNGVWYCPVSKLITDVEDQSNDIPSHFTLSQNYPNPFNPTTTIKYSIPLSEFVTLKIYDVLGNEVAILINEEQQAGNYEVEFSAKGGSASGGNAAGLSSGIYFYKLQSGGFIETKKMLLLK